jgi:hypothetical protein
MVLRPPGWRRRPKPTADGALPKIQFGPIRGYNAWRNLLCCLLSNPMPTAPKLTCPTCGALVRAHEKDCQACNTFCGFPNMRKAGQAEEATELERRYCLARAAASARGREAIFLAYEVALADSAAVVCRSLDQVKTLLSSESAVYTSFYRQRSSGARRAEDTPIETQREATDVRMFPSYNEHICFAALSLSGMGVLSYGACCLVLKSTAIAQRASAFWENSVDFCNRVCPEQTKPIPPGYRAPWPMRARLAAAKAEPELDAQSTREEFSLILLDGTRFIEVHIYGPFNRESFDRLLFPKASTKADRAMAAAIRDIILKDGLGIKVEEYS